MKNFKYFNIFSSVFFIMFFIYSCGKDAQDSKKEEIVLTQSNNLENRTNNLDEFRSFNLNFPQGTIISFNDFGIQFDLPEPFYILGIDGNGNFYRSVSGGAGTVTCSCTSGSGCDPIKNGDDEFDKALADVPLSQAVILFQPNSRLPWANTAQ